MVMCGILVEMRSRGYTHCAQIEAEMAVAAPGQQCTIAVDERAPQKFMGADGRAEKKTLPGVE